LGEEVVVFLSFVHEKYIEKALFLFELFFS